MVSSHIPAADYTAAYCRMESTNTHACVLRDIMASIVMWILMSAAQHLALMMGPVK